MIKPISKFLFLCLFLISCKSEKEQVYSEISHKEKINEKTIYEHYFLKKDTNISVYDERDENSLGSVYYFENQLLKKYCYYLNDSLFTHYKEFDKEGKMTEMKNTPMVDYEFVKTKDGSINLYMVYIQLLDSIVEVRLKGSTKSTKLHIDKREHRTNEYLSATYCKGLDTTTLKVKDYFLEILTINNEEKEKIYYDTLHYYK